MQSIHRAENILRILESADLPATIQEMVKRVLDKLTRLKDKMVEIEMDF